MEVNASNGGIYPCNIKDFFLFFLMQNKSQEYIHIRDGNEDL